MRCPSNDLLKAYLGGETGGAERDELEEHLQGCEACRDALARLESTQDPLANRLVGLCPSQVPDSNTPGSTRKRPCNRVCQSP